MEGAATPRGIAMPLTSPRFKNERELIAVEAGRAVLRRGSTGRHVHLVQMALIDLGFAMPISTLSQDYSPDGVYGVETESVVKAFQRSVPPPGLKPDGAVGQLTLRELDKRHPRFTHRVNLHFRSLSLSDIPFDRLMSNTAQAYAQYGIEARFASGQSLGLSPDQESRFNVVGQNCEWQMDSGEFAELHKLGTPVPSTDIAVFIVNQFQEQGNDGCAGHAAKLPACAVTHNCMQWTVAHELCHVLLTSSFVPVHTLSPRNLMFAGTWTGSGPPTLTERQTAKIRSNPLCRAI
jgi:putative peptidoglycan binding protein